jgi:hypothetical protein
MKLGNSQNGVAEEDAESFEAEDRVVPLGLEVRGVIAFEPFL